MADRPSATAMLTEYDPGFDGAACLGDARAFRAWVKLRGLRDYLRFGNIDQEEEYLVWQYENVEGMSRARRWWIAWYLGRSGRWARANRRKPWERVRPKPVAMSGQIDEAT